MIRRAAFFKEYDMKSAVYVRKGRALFTVLVAVTIPVLAFTGCEQPGGLTLDSDAALKELRLSAGNLTPPFNAGTTAYTVTVNNRIDTVRVQAEPNSEKASISPGGEISRPLTVGENKIDLVVSAENGDRKTYTVTVRRLDDTVAVIESAAELAGIGVDAAYPLAKNYILAANLELENWKPVGGGGESAFSGTFDGAGYTITIKNFDSAAFTENPACLGIFAYTRGSAESKAAVKNLKVRTELNHSITGTGDYYVGALVGYADEYTELSNIIVEGSLGFSNDSTAAPRKPVYVGGVAGVLVASELKNSLVSADITGFGKGTNGIYNYVGGAVGMFDRNAVTRGSVPAPLEGEVFTGASITQCRVTGNVTGATEGSGTNIFAGGIAGGAAYGMKTYYSGKIEDCSFTGKVNVRGGAYWSWAGGIAGTICGDGYDNSNTEVSGSSDTGPTRIVRCHSAGTVTAAGPAGSWPYAGGIVGCNYYGGLVSQSSFNGTVLVEGSGINDYAGGIAGYNSKQYYGHSSKIEDCWSAGAVEGYLNAGGIVGQNQVAAITERCYSRSLVSVRAVKDARGSASQQGAGGIAGYNAAADSRSAGTLRNCVALNPSIESIGGFDLLHRIAGDGGGVLSGNLAKSGMTITISGIPSTNTDPGVNARDGGDCAEQPEKSVYEGLGWDFNGVWKMADGYPVLQWQ
jgi:hypothetical protein